MNGIVGMPSGKRYLKSNGYKVPVSIKNRFYEKTLLPNENGCMEWIGAITKKGYGSLWVDKINKIKYTSYAHRLSYLLHYGSLPQELDICHKCDNTKCVAPNHLYAGTAKDNMKDRTDRKRYFNTKGINHPQHKLTEENVIDIKKRLLLKQTHREIAKLYNVDKTTITAINLKRIWRHL